MLKEKTTILDETGDKFIEIENESNGFGVTLEFNQSGVLQVCRIFEKTEGWPSSVLELDGSGNITRKHNLIFGENRRLEGAEIFDDNGNRIRFVKFEYDNKGRAIKTKVFNENDDLMYTCISDYEEYECIRDTYFDRNGNQIDEPEESKEFFSSNSMK